MKIVILDAYTANPGDLSWNELESLGDLSVYDRTPANLIIERAQDASAILTNKVILDANIINSLPNLKYIGILATGCNVVDLKHASLKRIIVTNVPQYSTESVVQNVFAHILNITSQISLNSSAVRQGAWSRSPDFSFTNGPLVELHGKRLGIIGLGTIGKRVAQVAITFGMQVIAFGPHLNIGCPYSGVEAVSIESLFETSNVISLHCPLTEETKHLVSKRLLNKVRKGTILINTGRGDLLNEQDVADALRTGQLGGVGVDVLSTEPPQQNNPLLNSPNCYITPHTAWATQESRKRLIQIAINNLKAFMNNQLINVVNG